MENNKQKKLRSFQGKKAIKDKYVNRLETQIKPIIRKKKGYLIVSCPLCPVNFIATSEEQAHSNFNRHSLFKHTNGDDGNEPFNSTKIL